MTLKQIKARGFDLSTMNSFYASVRCSHCDANVINGTPTHEKGCPNDYRECAGCNELIPPNHRYCNDCR